VTNISVSRGVGSNQKVGLCRARRRSWIGCNECLTLSLVSATRGSSIVVCRHSSTTNCTGWMFQRGSPTSSASWRTIVCMDKDLSTLPITSLQALKLHLDISYVLPTNTSLLCLAVDSTRTAVGLFLSCTLCQTNSEIWRVNLTAVNSTLKQSCSAFTSATNALEVIFYRYAWIHG